MNRPKSPATFWQRNRQRIINTSAIITAGYAATSIMTWLRSGRRDRSAASSSSSSTNFLTKTLFVGPFVYAAYVLLRRRLGHGSSVLSTISLAVSVPYHMVTYLAKEMVTSLPTDSVRLMLSPRHLNAQDGSLFFSSNAPIDPAESIPHVHRYCNVTLLSFLPQLRERVQLLFGVDQLADKLRSSPANKVAIWNEMKVSTLAQLFTAIYASSFLTLIGRIEFSMLFGSALAKQHDNTSRNELSEVDYFHLIESFLGVGMERVRQVMMPFVTETFGRVSLKAEFSADDLLWQLFSMQQHAADSGLYPQLVKLCCDPSAAEQTPPKPGLIVNGVDRRIGSQPVVSQQILNDSQDILLSRDAQSLFERLLSVGIDQSLVDSPLLKSNSTTLALARAIPVINQMMLICLCDPPNALFQKLCLFEPLKQFGSNVFLSYAGHGL